MDTDLPVPSAPEAVPSAPEVVPSPSTDKLSPEQPSTLDTPAADLGHLSAVTHANVVVASGGRDYPSLYDGQYTTIIAVVLGLVIVGGIQALAWQIYRNAKTDYRALTQFVTMMVGLVLGAYMADLLIAGPSTSLLSDDEHTVILGFVKDICLMVFSYYFGTRSNGGKPEHE